MSVPSVIAEKPEAVGHVLHGEQILAILHEMLPAGSALAVSWRDWTLGSGSVVAPMSAQELRSQAEQALAGADGISLGGDGRSLVHAWDSADGSARLALAASAPAWLGDAERQAWLKMASTLVDAVFGNARAQTRIVKLEKSKRLQHALFEIAELAGADMDMQDMLGRIHAVIGSLLYAENCYIALYDDERQVVRYLYYNDRLDPYVADPWREWTEADMPDSLTFAVLRHGQPMRGPSAQVRRRLGVPYNPANGQESADWLGVPMHSDKRVRGLVVVQNYDQANVYGDEERVLLSYVAQHILTALERRHAHEDLERRIEVRTDELRKANRELMSEIIERERAEELQQALFRITELAVTSESLERFYANVHAVVDELIYARNFYIALLSDDGSQVDFPYCADVHHDSMASYRREPAAGEDILKQLAEHAAQQAKGAPAHSWLGAPLYSDGQVVGVVAVQSYTPEVSFNNYDQDLLSFVAHHIGNGLARQRADERLRRMHAELEQRVEERTRELARVNASLRVEIDERQRAEQRLIRQATHDGLTGLPNRLHLLERLSTEIRRARYGDGDSFAVLFLDLDRFKLVNDSVGHDAGDSLLNEVAKRITSAVSSNGTVARLGGDEFVVVSACPGGKADSASELARRIQKELNAPLRIEGRELYPSASIGIAVWNPSYRNGDELLRDADAAMYYAKSEGRAHWAIFDASMREMATRKLELEADMRRAIESRSFVPFYQPIRRLHDGVLVGHEALIRWQHETRGLLLPGEFLSVGEESGLIELADWQIYRQVAQRLVQAGSGYVSINVSPRHLGQPDFSDRLLAMMASAQADASRLRLEITEMALLDDAPSTRRSLQALHENGVRIFLDDFGTGYSALSYLHRFPISALKIDRSFVAGIGNADSPESLALVRAIVAMANSMGIDTVAEGVETEAQLQALTAIGCTCVQGYLIGRPAADIRMDDGQADGSQIDGSQAGDDGSA